MARMLRPSVTAGLATFLIAGAGLAAPKQLGMNVHQSQGVGLDATRDSGTKWVRIDLNWLDVEKTQGQYDWTTIDAVVDGAKQRGLEVLAVIAYGPAWASQADVKGDGPNNDIPKAGTYASFVTAVVSRYQTKVTHYELWNEPNLGGFFEGTPQDYIDRILTPGADALHAACPACQVVAPGLASLASSKYDVWLDACLKADAAKIDILSGHIYAGFPQDGGTVGVTSDSFYNRLESHRVLKFGSTVVFEGPLSFKEVMDQNQWKKPFWLTETGQEAPLGDAAKEQAQLTYYRHTLESMLVRPWWETTIFYESFDEPPAPYTWGIVVHDETQPKKYSPKAVMAFLQGVTAKQPAFGGTGTDCDDLLDNDDDGNIDFPADPDCKSASGTSEGAYTPPPGSDGGPPIGGYDGGVDDAGTADDAGNVAGSSGGCSASAVSPAPWGASIPFAALGLAACARRRRRR